MIRDTSPSDGEVPSDEDILRALDDFDIDTPLTGRECLRNSIYEQLMELESHRVTPELEMTEAIDIPFGSLGQAQLSGDLHQYVDGSLRGWLQILDETGEQTLERIIRDPSAPRWEGPIYDENRNIYNDEVVLRKLEKAWPWNSYDNSTIRESAAHPKDPGAELYAIFRDELLPHAGHQVRTREYARVSMVPNEAQTIYTPVATRLRTVDRRNSDETELTISLEHTISIEINSVPTVLTVVAHISDSGDIGLESYYKHPETRKPINQPIKDEFTLVAELIAALNQLVADKLATKQ